MIRAVYGLMGLGMCLVSAPALANLSLVNYNGFEVRQSGNTWTFSHEPPSSTALRGGTVLPNAQVSTSQRALVVAKTLPVGKGLPVDVVAKIPAANLARALAAAGRFGTPIGAALGVIEIANYLKDLGINNVKNTPNGLEAEAEPVDVKISTGFEWYVYDIKKSHVKPEAACMIAAVDTGLQYGKVAGPYPDGTMGCYNKVGNNFEWMSTMRKIASTACPAGWFIAETGCYKEMPSRKIVEQEIIDKIALDSGWPTSAAIAAQKAINMGIPIKTDAPTVSGPSSVPGEKTQKSESVGLNPGTNTIAAPGTTNTDPGTKTTTKTTTEKATYSGSNVTTSTTTNTVTNITNNITNITKTETETETKEDDKEQEDPPIDSPFKDIPELYKQKYPDGIGGVVNKSMNELKTTPLFGLPALLTPSLPSTGSCPSWQLDLSLASWAGYGVQTVQAPCWVWDFGKVVIIISALLLARRLIFGG